MIRKLFRRLGWFMPLLRSTGLAPRMTAKQPRSMTDRTFVLHAASPSPGAKFVSRINQLGLRDGLLVRTVTVPGKLP